MTAADPDEGWTISAAGSLRDQVFDALDANRDEFLRFDTYSLQQHLAPMFDADDEDQFSIDLYIQQWLASKDGAV